MYREIVYNGNTERALKKRMEEIKENEEEIFQFEIKTYAK